MRPSLVGAGRSTGRLPRWVAVAALVALGAPLPCQDPPHQVLVLRVGTLHPVDGPAIEDAILIVKDGRIEALGKADAVAVPAGAEVLSYPSAHAYPGLVDPSSTAFADPKLLGDGSLDAGVDVEAGLDPFDEGSREVVEGGVTTAYVANRSDSPWRGQGALIRPRADGFVPFGQDVTVAVHLRLTTGPGNSHPLQRHDQLERAVSAFDQLEDYEKGFEEHEKKLKDYEKKFTEYLDWYEKHGGEVDKQAGGQPEEKPAERPQRPRGRGRRGRPGGNGDRERPEPAPEPEKQAGDKPAAGDDKKADDKKPEEKAPERPQYPKPPKRDPAKDALIEVRDGERPLFVEAHRTDEIRMALDLARTESRSRIVLEDPTAAATMAEDIASAGIPVVFTDVEPPIESPYVEKREQARDPVTALVKAGATVAIGSGSVPRARNLTLIAADAVGCGLDPDTALRAITLAPAEILGVQDEVGSLAVGKRADVVIASGPLFESATRVLRVLADGDTVFEEHR